MIAGGNCLCTVVVRHRNLNTVDLNDVQVAACHVPLDVQNRQRRGWPGATGELLTQLP